MVSSESQEIAEIAVIARHREKTGHRRDRVRAIG
jgi:hypothetical protein